MSSRKNKMSDDIWQQQKEAHLIHHRIADFIIHHDDREQPPRLRTLLKKYRAMMAAADVATD